MNAHALRNQRTRNQSFIEGSQNREAAQREAMLQRIRARAMSEQGISDEDAAGMQQAKMEVMDEAAAQRAPMESENSSIEAMLQYMLAQRQAQAEAQQAEPTMPAMRQVSAYGMTRPEDIEQSPTEMVDQLVAQRRAMAGRHEASPSQPGRAPIPLDAALAASIPEGLAGLARGALAMPAMVGDIANLAHAGTSILTGHPENATAPSEFKYGFQGATDALAKIPGLRRDKDLGAVGEAGEMLGMFHNPYARLARQATAAEASPLSRYSQLALPAPKSAGLPAEMSRAMLEGAEATSLPSHNFPRLGYTPVIREPAMPMSMRAAAPAWLQSALSGRLLGPVDATRAAQLRGALRQVSPSSAPAELPVGDSRQWLMFPQDMGGTWRRPGVNMDQAARLYPQVLKMSNKAPRVPRNIQDKLQMNLDLNSFTRPDVRYEGVGRGERNMNLSPFGEMSEQMPMFAMAAGGSVR